MIRIRGLKKSYGGQPVLDIDELNLEEGLRYAILGPNGAGKSTFLRILAGVLPADAGEIDFSRQLKKNEVIYLPQKPYAFSFSVQKNVSVAITEKMTEIKKRQLAEKALQQMGMQQYAAYCGNSLSGGETQRMCLARMLVEKHSLMLLDEPTSATDVAGSDLIENSLRHYLDETGCTLLFSTHQPAQAMRFSQRALFFHRGKLCESGVTANILQNPQNPLTKEFIRHWKI